MKKFFLLRISIFFLVVFGSTGRLLAESDIIVNGEFNFSDSYSDIKVYIYSSLQFSETGNKYKNANKIEGEVTSDKFKIELNEETDLFYIKMVVVKEEEDISADLGLNEIFLVEKGDRINLVISDSSITVSGRGANLFRYQYSLYNTKPLYTRNETVFLNKKDYASAFTERAQQVLSYIKEFEFNLNVYKELFSEDVYNQLYVDGIGRFYSKLMQPLKLQLIRMPEDGIVEAKNYFYKYIYPQKLDSINDVYLARSPYYVEFLIKKELFNIKLQNVNYRDEVEFKNIFNIINTNYSGELRDKANLVLFITFDSKNPSLHYFDLAINQMETVNIKNQLIEIKLLKSKKVRVFDFVLTDPKGKIYTPESFIGKTVLADFWFVGCLPCLNLAPLLKEFVNKYKEQDDFVFISVNIDKNIPRWLDAIEEGRYTSTDILNLNAKGFDDPFLIHYNYGSVPKLMVIDKKGNLISSNAPRPIRPNQIKELEELIGISF